MGRVLSSTVVVYHPDEPGKAVSLPAGSELPDWAEGLVDDSRLDNPLDRLADVGATDDEIDALQRVWLALTDEQRATAREANPTDDDLRGYLAELRDVASEHGVSIGEAVDRAIAEGLTPDTSSEPAAGGEPPTAAPLESRKKDELLTLAADNHVDVGSRATKDEIVEALRAAGIEG